MLAFTVIAVYYYPHAHSSSATNATLFVLCLLLTS